LAVFLAVETKTIDSSDLDTEFRKAKAIAGQTGTPKVSAGLLQEGPNN